MHSDAVDIDIERVANAGPLRFSSSLKMSLWILVLVGVLTFSIGVLSSGSPHAWAVFYVNVLYFMGLACGGVIITAIVQIVRAKWAPPVRRVCEANVAFLPIALVLLAITYFGRQHLFYWGSHPMPGREWWMRPGFVYARYLVLLGLLFLVFWTYVRLSLRSDLGWLSERPQLAAKWKSIASFPKSWRGGGVDVLETQRKLSFRAPILLALYAVIYSLFSFDMVMGMDEAWMSNMFGGFIFVGNVFMAWAFTAVLTVYLCYRHQAFNQVIERRQLWDLGMLTFAFCMLWGYLFFCQFLPQWYGNMPEETQWLILRTREFPWKALGWPTFCLCFVIPYILLLSEDLKKAPKVFSFVCLLILVGMWFEKYLIVMPQVSPGAVPLSFLEVGIAAGFLGGYLLAVLSFLERYPFIPISHPLTVGDTEW